MNYENNITWEDEWVDAKVSGGEKYKFDLFHKIVMWCCNEARERNARWLWFVIPLVLIFAGAFLGGWYAFACVVLLVGFGFCVFVRFEKPLAVVSDGTEDVYRLLIQVGAIKQGERYDDWNVYANGEYDEQKAFVVDCRAPGVDLAKLSKSIELEAKKFRWTDGERVYNTYVTNLGGSRFEYIFDNRNPHEQTSEIYDFMGQGNGLKPWSLPVGGNGKPNGQIALGAVDLGRRYGSVNTGFLYGCHFGISGISGYGKSNAIHFLLWQLSQFENVQILYIDPNETDGNLWRERVYLVGREGAVDALGCVMEELKRRAAFMKKNNKLKWTATPGTPQLVVVIDEVKFLINQEKTAKKTIEDLLAIGRKYGVTCILGTQYPKKEYVGGAWENLHFKLSSKLNNETETAVVFGAKANEAPCDKIETRGTFYVCNDKNKIERVHIPYVPEEVVLDMANRTSGIYNAKLMNRMMSGGAKSSQKKTKFGF